MRFQRMAFGMIMSSSILLRTLAFAASNVPSDADNAAFLSSFKNQPGVISKPDGLEYRIIHNGLGKRPGLADTVEINYTGNLINGVTFDGSAPGLPATFAVGGVIQGLSEALQLMHEGDRWQVVVPPNLAFGVRGSSNGSVPPNQVLMFDLALVLTSASPLPRTEDSSPLSISADQSGQKARLTIHP